MSAIYKRDGSRQTPISAIYKADIGVRGYLARIGWLVTGMYGSCMGKEKARCGGMNAAGLVEPTVVEIYVDILPFYGYFMFLW